jgi:general secretion pathway protein D
MVTIHAIAQAGKAKVLSRPSVLARNNQPATITVGQSVPLINSVRYDNFGNAINSVNYEDVGIILRVTPFIGNDGMVEMIVSPEISSLTDQSVAISTGVSVPVIAKRSADTVVVTPDGQTVIIGGLMQNNKTSADSKIPFLGDIPWLGNLFKRQGRNSSKTELLIFLTPHIVEAPAQLVSLSERERAAAQLPSKAFTEEELDRFLDELPSKKPSKKKSAK